MPANADDQCCVYYVSDASDVIQSRGRNNELAPSFYRRGSAVGPQFGSPGVTLAQNMPYSYVANTAPPDAFLALKAYPSANSQRIMAMANGTKLNVLLRRADGWWFVKVWPTGEQGWAFSGRGGKAYILCCAEAGGRQTEAEPVVRDVADFDCAQLWFGRNSVFKEAGYCFTTSKAISVFGNAGCRYDDINAVVLTPENQNFVETIQGVERAKACPR